ncbi:uncharacterized protein NESG_01605 [Nematocida ausubeli]|uniref:FH2 domain-containing protein n=1 Tax=Nematocida ausubeli (strain ATCC PRA-371 / ERTm2) TaxID=1913371 RepID=A0A086J0F9_NEMA1|nr:uncharacterized protein NESG_01605 [Nematocida ausubeli]KFG25627.1 hypothetical protein NESG_01605 [Nematocida ausubeli]
MRDSSSTALAQEFQSLLEELGIEGENRKVLLALPTEQKLRMINAQNKSMQISGIEIANQFKNIKKPFSISYNITDIEEYIKEIRILRLKFVELTEREVEKAIEKNLLVDVWGIISALAPKAEVQDSRMYLQLENTKQNKPIYRILEPTVNFFKTLLKSPAIIRSLQSSTKLFTEIFMHFPSEYAGISTIILQIAAKCSTIYMDVFLDYLFRSSKHEVHAYCIPACDIRMKRILDEIHYNLTFRTIDEEYAIAFLHLLVDFYSEPPLVGIMLDSLLRMCDIGRVLSKIESTFCGTRKLIGEVIEMQEKVRSMAGEIDVRQIQMDTEDTKKDLTYIVNVLSVLNRINSSRIYDVVQYIRGCVLEESVYKNKDIAKIEQERAIRKKKAEKETYTCICKDIIRGKELQAPIFPSPTAISVNSTQKDGKTEEGTKQKDPEAVSVSLSESKAPSALARTKEMKTPTPTEKTTSQRTMVENEGFNIPDGILTKIETDSLVSKIIKNITRISLTKDQCISLKKAIDGRDALVTEKNLPEDTSKVPISTSPSNGPPCRPPGAPLNRPPVAPIIKPPTMPLGRPPTAPINRPPVAPLNKPPTAPISKPPTMPLGKPPVAPLSKPPTMPLGKPPTAPLNKPPIGGSMPSVSKMPAPPIMKKPLSGDLDPGSTVPIPTQPKIGVCPPMGIPKNDFAKKSESVPSKETSTDETTINSAEVSKPGPRALYIEQAALLQPSNPQQIPYEVHIRKPGTTGLWSVLDKSELTIFKKEDFSAFERKKVDKTVEEEKAIVDGVIDKKRCKSIDIALARVKIPYEKLIEAVANINPEPFNETLISGLLKSYPTDEEVELIRKHPVQLAPEVFFKKAIAVPWFKDKLMILHLKITLPNIQNVLLPNVHKLTEGCQLLLQEKSIHKIMRTTLGIINILNSNGRNQGAWGIKLETLPRILENSSLVLLIQEKMKKDSLKIQACVTVLSDVVKISTDIIETDCQEYYSKKELIETIDIAKEHKKSISSLLKELNNLQEAYLKWRSSMEELRLFMGEKEFTGASLQILSKYIINVHTFKLPKK